MTINLDEIRALNDDDLAMEISIAEGFGDDIDPNAEAWRLALVLERYRRAVAAANA